MKLRRSTRRILTLDRRGFLETAGLATAAAAIGNLSAPLAHGAKPPRPAELTTPEARQTAAYQLRRDAALFQKDQPIEPHLANGDEAIPGFVATFSKTLPHDNLGQVDPAAYTLYLKALASGLGADFDAIPMGGPGKLQNPQAAYAFTLEGPDGQLPVCPAPPSFSSAAMADELVEDYWMALTRDVPFAQFDTSPVIQQAADELTTLSAFSGPKVNGAVTPATIFRGPTSGDLKGPFVSQFLLKPVPYGMTTVNQNYNVLAAGADFMTTGTEWLSVERGFPPTGKLAFDSTARYIRCGRDLLSYVHTDFSYQSALNAAFILLSMGNGILSNTNPYKNSSNQSGFVTFAAPMILDWIGRVSTAVLKATWCEKWLVHRRIRPEEFAGRVHNLMTGAAQYSIHSDVTSSKALALVHQQEGTYYLPQAYPEGCPAHPSYPAGHAVLIGAGVTVLKAMFDTSAPIPNPLEASPDGLSLLPYTGQPLTIGDELNKLASNISLARDMAGVHYRSDGVQGILLGEAVALGVLHDLAQTLPEQFEGFLITRFDGSQVVIGGGGIL